MPNLIHIPDTSSFQAAFRLALYEETVVAFDTPELAVNGLRMELAHNVGALEPTSAGLRHKTGVKFRLLDTSGGPSQVMTVRLQRSEKEWHSLTGLDPTDWTPQETLKLLDEGIQLFIEKDPIW